MISRRRGLWGAAAAWMGSWTAPAFAKAPMVGQPAPNFQVTAFDGRKVSLAGLRGQVVVLNFWATWCPPCRVELPLLESYYQIQKPFGLQVVAVTTEDSAPLYMLRPLAAKATMTMARWFKGGGYPEAAQLPTNYVIDRGGILRYAKAGAFTLDTLNAVLVPLLRDPEPPTASEPVQPDKASSRS